MTVSVSVGEVRNRVRIRVSDRVRVTDRVWVTVRFRDMVKD